MPIRSSRVGSAARCKLRVNQCGPRPDRWRSGGSASRRRHDQRLGLPLRDERRGGRVGEVCAAAPGERARPPLPEYRADETDEG